MQKNNEKINDGSKKRYPWLTDEEVEQEIERLSQSEEVALARRAAALKYKRRQRLYTLRDLEKKGKALLEAGITRKVLDAMYAEDADV